MKLILPDVRYKDSFLEALDEYQKEEPTDKHLRNEYYNSLNKSELKDRFEEYVETVISHARGENQPKGFVPETTYWLVDGSEFIGRINIRHELNDFLLREAGHIGYDIRPSKRGKGYGIMILKLALQKARELKLDKVLVTCSVNNLASKKVIEENGGIFENKVAIGEGKPEKLRYWINLI